MFFYFFILEVYNVTYEHIHFKDSIQRNKKYYPSNYTDYKEFNTFSMFIMLWYVEIFKHYIKLPFPLEP